MIAASCFMTNGVQWAWYSCLECSPHHLHRLLLYFFLNSSFLFCLAVSHASVSPLYPLTADSKGSFVGTRLALGGLVAWRWMVM
jgi:hypothetical protein